MQPFLVTKVIDADTFEVSPGIPPRFALQTPMQRLRGERLVETTMEQLARPNTFKKVRLGNINAPESWTPQGEQAVLYLKDLIEGKRVILQPTDISDDEVVADVWRYPNRFFINAAMVYRGHAQWTSGTL